MALYHDYRPQRFADLFGQDSIRDILRSALSSDRLSHAYLFSGSRGTGKTTTARLLAKAINCLSSQATNPGTSQSQSQSSSLAIEPCNNCLVCQAITSGSCLDVIEIDAASNRGIDEIRELQEQVRFRPQVASKKVIIIDEAHMLTKEAFNALLKTLEEPPDYLVFILATTEIHKLPATIISRCQRFDFMKPTSQILANYLESICQKAKLVASSDGLLKIAELSAGSYRDSLTILEQLAAKLKTIDLKGVIETFGLPKQELVDRYLAALGNTPDKNLLAELQDYFTRGGNANAFLEMTFMALQANITNPKVKDPLALLVKLTRIKYRMRYSPVEELPIIVELPNPISSQELKYTGQEDLNKMETDTNKAIHIEKISDREKSTSHQISRAKAPTVENVSASDLVVIDLSDNQIKGKVSVEVAEQVPLAVLPDNELTVKWQAALTKLIADNQSSMVSILRTAKPRSWRAPTLEISVQFKFHADQLSKQRNRGILEATFSDVFGSEVRIEPVIIQGEDLTAAAEEIFS